MGVVNLGLLAKGKGAGDNQVDIHERLISVVADEEVCRVDNGG